MLKFDYKILKKNRDHYIKRLNDIYHNMVAKSGLDYYKGFGKFLGPKQVQV